MQRTGELTILCALALLSAGCSDDANRVVGGAEPPNWEWTFALQDAAGRKTSDFGLGDRVDLVLTVRNQTDSYQTLEFPTSQVYEFHVRDAAGGEVWRWGHGRAFAQAAKRIDFRPRQAIVFPESWFQQRNDLSPVGSGSYAADGRLLASNAAIVSAPAPLNIN